MNKIDEKNILDDGLNKSELDLFIRKLNVDLEIMNKMFDVSNLPKNYQKGFINNMFDGFIKYLNKAHKKWKENE